VSAVPKTLSKLYQLARRVTHPPDPALIETNPIREAVVRASGSRVAPDPEEERKYISGLDPVGLILLAPPRYFAYWCTPVNSLTFAHTGGDGCHFGLLWGVGGFTEASPVVMTVPDSDAPNMVVGGDLLEFLALGCRHGYFGLNGLVQDRGATLEALGRRDYDVEASPEQRDLLELLASVFDLEPWNDPETRLKHLDQEFAASIKMPPT